LFDVRDGNVTGLVPVIWSARSQLQRGVFLIGALLDEGGFRRDLGCTRIAREVRSWCG